MSKQYSVVLGFKANDSEECTVGTSTLTLEEGEVLTDEMKNEVLEMFLSSRGFDANNGKATVKFTEIK